MFPLIITVLHRDYNWEGGGGGAMIPFKDCSYKGEHPPVQGFRVYRVSRV